MAKVSASTLVRRAAAFEKQKQPTVAKALRRKAAKLRADARKAKRAKKAAPKKKVMPPEEMQTASQAAGSAPAGSMGFAYDGPSDSWKETSRDQTIIGPDQIEYLRGAAKSRVKDVDSFAIRLRAMMLDAKLATTKDANNKAMERLKTSIEAQHINVVCAFLAEMAALSAMNRGPLPRIIMVSGYTIARVVDALRAAGYTEEGKGGVLRR